MGFKPCGESLGTGFYDLTGKLIAKIERNIPEHRSIFKLIKDGVSRPKDDYPTDSFHVKLIEHEKEYRIQEYWDRFGILRAPWVSIVDSSDFGVMAGNYSPHHQIMYINRYDDDTEVLFIILLHCMTFMYSFRYG
ncbi:MAG: hypothetical protein FWD31_09875 [Planctomycetaceae bacterium]|nr:hypothetical protein [Planctomycetaceae bacterium]